MYKLAFLNLQNVFESTAADSELKLVLKPTTVSPELKGLGVVSLRLSSPPSLVSPVLLRLRLVLCLAGGWSRLLLLLLLELQ